MEIIPTVKIVNRDGIKAVKNGQKANKFASIPAEKKPSWIRVKASFDPKYKLVKNQVASKKLNTVCEEAMCPNISECWSSGTATFMLMGSVCTRACKFCSVDTGNPKGWLDQEEPLKTAKAVRTMGLKYVVLTSVNRDDLEDGGAEHYAQTVQAIKDLNPNTAVEALTPDFKGYEPALKIVFDAKPDIFSHNVECVERISKAVRAQANWKRSLGVLEKSIQYGLRTKTGIMVGLGEKTKEVKRTMKQVVDLGVQIFTIGQYLQPTKNHLKVQEYVSKEQFEAYKEYGYSIGFKVVESGPLVRSSYHADEQARMVFNNG